MHMEASEHDKMLRPRGTAQCTWKPMSTTRWGRQTKNNFIEHGSHRARQDVVDQLEQHTLHSRCRRCNHYDRHASRRDVVVVVVMCDEVKVAVVGKVVVVVV